MLSELRMTALHEAAHAVVAVVVGVKVTGVSIRPEPASDILPGSLGRVFMSSHPDPRPEDCWPGSHWVETWVMSYLAGYAMESLADPKMQGPLACAWDHLMVVDLLRAFSPRDPALAMSHLQELHAKTVRLIDQDWVMDDILSVSDALMQHETLSGPEFYRMFYRGRCSAVSSLEPHSRCNLPPHPYGDHAHVPPPVEKREPTYWAGIARPPRNQRVGAMTSTQKIVRGLNRSHGPRPLPATWRRALTTAKWSGIPS